VSLNVRVKSVVTTAAEASAAPALLARRATNKAPASMRSVHQTVKTKSAEETVVAVHVESVASPPPAKMAFALRYLPPIAAPSRPTACASVQCSSHAMHKAK